MFEGLRISKVWSLAPRTFGFVLFSLLSLCLLRFCFLGLVLRVWLLLVGVVFLVLDCLSLGFRSEGLFFFRGLWELMSSVWS